MKSLSSKSALILLAVVTVLLLSANNLFFKGARVDLTQDKLFSVSSGTDNIVKGLEQQVVLKFFYSERDSSGLGFIRDYARRITDLLNEYELRSAGNVSLQVVDPDPFSEEEDEAASFGLQRISLGYGDEPIFFGLVAYKAEGNTESESDQRFEVSEKIDFLHPDREEFLEYDVSKLIRKAGRTRAPKIAMISGLQVTGGVDPVQSRPTQPWTTYTQLRQLYEIDILEGEVDDIDPAFDMLLLIHPHVLTEKTVYAIDQFALQGGNVLAFVDTFAQTDHMQGMGAARSTADSTFTVLLDKWGVELIADKILGDAAHALRVGGGASQRPTPHLAVVGYGQQNFVSTDNPITSQLNNIIFSSASVIRAKQDATTEFEPLIQSSDQSGLIDSRLLQNLVDPAQLTDGFVATGENYTVAAHVTGTTETAFPKGRPQPAARVDSENTAGTSQDTSQNTAQGTGNKADLANVISGINSGEDGADAAGTLRQHVAGGADQLNVFIVADTDVLNDPLWVRLENFMGQRMAKPFADNGNFFINAAENILGSTDLMSLRSRGTYARPFHVVEQLEREAAGRFQDKERELQSRLQQTETRLGALQQQKEGENVQDLSEAQQQEVDDFRAEQLSIRKELREVQHQLGEDIEKLGGWVKLLNIALVPVLVTFFALVFRRVRKTKAARVQAAYARG